MDKWELADKATDLVLLGLLILQEVSGMSRQEVLEKIQAEGDRTDELKKQLRPV
jgi:hypothetical protein